MKRKNIRIHKAAAVLGCMLLWAALLSMGAAAEESASIDVYVAGNDDLYPIEYYDASSEQYEGLMPDIYQKVSEQTGYHFVYLSPGSSDQERMAKNGQAELISAYEEGEISSAYCRHPIAVTKVETAQGEKTVYVAFSEIASEELISSLTQAISGLSDAQKLSMLVSHTKTTGYDKKYEIWVYVLASLLLLFMAIAIVIFLRWRSKKKKSGEDLMMDAEYGIGNDQYYVYCFDNLISNKSKALYYVAYIAFDEKEYKQKVGEEECHQVERYTAEFLNRQAGAVDYLARINNGIYVLIYQAANRTEAEARIASVIKELDLYLINMKEEYAKLFQAGVCALEENMDCSSETAFYSANQGYLQAVSKKQPFAFSTKTMIAKAHRQEELQRRIMQAIKDGEFVIHLQYVVSRDGSIYGAEAVSRWQHPREGLLAPSQYIAMINQSDIVTLHDLYIFSLVCKQLEEWKGTDREGLFISCNFTRYSMCAPDFGERIRETAEKHDFDHQKLVIEITEDLLSSDAAVLKKSIEQCKQLGFLIALDDIGSGYSSLADLYNYPIDVVKVERDIVLQAMEPRGKMLLEGLVKLAHSMNMKVLCEGVETSEQNERILDMGCDYIQGFFYSHPLPLKEADRFWQQDGKSGRTENDDGKAKDSDCG